MTVDLDALVRRLQAVEARHPDTVADLEPVIRALTDAEATLGTEQARKLLGVRSVNTVKRWLELGILKGSWDDRSGRWRIPLAEVLRTRDRQAALAGSGGDELTAEELAILSDARPGAYPWQRGERA
jgi:hypothetical protein